MGYRSDVGLAITGSALTEVIEGNSELTEKVRECLDSADTHLKSECGNHLFLWDDVKWYPFDYVQALESRLNEIDCESYRFIRLGEESNDTETHGDWFGNDFDFGFIRELTFYG